MADNAEQRIPTPELNRFLGDLQSTREPPSVRGKRLRMYYMAQFETGPPRFAVQVNDRSRVTRDYAYFLENRLRDRYGLQGVPLVIDFKTSSGPRGVGAPRGTRSAPQGRSCAPRQSAARAQVWSPARATSSQTSIT